MAEPVELLFVEKGVDPIIADVERLAKALDKLPSRVTIQVGATGAPSFAGGSRAPMTAAMTQSFYQGSPGFAAPLPASTTAAAYRVQATAVAKAATAATGGLQGIASALGSIHPVAALAVAGLGAVAAGVAALQQRNVGSITGDFLFGKGGGASARGIAESVGGDPVSGPQALQNAIDNDPVVRSEAIRAGINPNGSIYGGDTDLGGKYKRFLDYLSDRNNGEKDARMAAYVANRATVGNEVAQLSAMPNADRLQAINNRVDISSADQSEAAKRQAEWNRIEARAKAGGGKAANWLADLFISTVSAGFIDGVSGLDRLISGAAQGGKSSGPASAADKIESAADKMGRAAEMFSNAAEGVAGGGPRSRHPFPPGWGYTNYEQAAFGDAARLGIL